MWRPINELISISKDAIDYNSPEELEFFRKLFIQNNFVDKILDKKKYYVIGDKGTGKTAYGVYLSNELNSEMACQLISMQETSYGTFTRLKTNNFITIAEYRDIWKVIIMLLCAEHIRKTEDNNFFGTKFKHIEYAIDSFYRNAFSPEIQYAVSIVEQSEYAVKLFSQLPINGNLGNTQTITYPEHRIQLDLLVLERQFADALSDLKYAKSHIVFIDGIDARPNSIPFNEYMECVKGLIEAVWSLNTSVFNNDQISRKIKVMLLIRPDIFDKAGMHNMNSRIRDNSVMLDWQTSYLDYRNSGLFKIADQLLRAQQDDYQNISEGESWDHYFPYKTYNTVMRQNTDSSFIPFLRYSFYRPRDIVTYIDILRNEACRNGKFDAFGERLFMAQSIQSARTDYLLSEIKDNLSFYYDSQDFDLFRSFFEDHLRAEISGTRFNYANFINAYNNFVAKIKQTTGSISYIFSTYDVFLQILYELNIVSWIEPAANYRVRETQHWYFKERSSSNIRPKIRGESSYQIHHGIAQALGLKSRYNY